MPHLRARFRFHASRNSDAGSSFELFFVCAITSIVVLRVYLELTGYPQVGGGGLHIAHMLWGGLGMLLAIVVLLGFIGRQAKRWGAVAGGIGFGLFIDEVGKFVTSDNNYFFQPAFAIMYVVFVLLFVSVRAIDRGIRLSSDGYLTNALRIMQDSVLHGLDQAQRDRALYYLSKCDDSNPLTGALRQALAAVPAPPAQPPGLVARVANRVRDAYFGLVGRRWFGNVLTAWFVLYAVILTLQFALLIVLDPRFALDNPNFTLSDWGDLTATALSTVALLIGVVRLRRSRLEAYAWFKRAVLVSIFLSTVFSFYQYQLGALYGLGFDLLLLLALDYLLDSERSAGEASAARALVSAPPDAARAAVPSHAG
jgi:hypothetical protein